jgi:hypothetical protein
MRGVILLFVIGCIFWLPLTSMADTIYLEDGSVLKGTITHMDENRIIITTKYGTYEISRHLIARIEKTPQPLSNAPSNDEPTSSSDPPEFQVAPPLFQGIDTSSDCPTPSTSIEQPSLEETTKPTESQPINAADDEEPGTPLQQFFKRNFLGLSFTLYLYEPGKDVIESSSYIPQRGLALRYFSKDHPGIFALGFSKIQQDEYYDLTTYHNDFGFISHWNSYFVSGGVRVNEWKFSPFIVLGIVFHSFELNELVDQSTSEFLSTQDKMIGLFLEAGLEWFIIDYISIGLTIRRDILGTKEDSIGLGNFQRAYDDFFKSYYFGAQLSINI